MSSSSRMAFYVPEGMLKEVICTKCKKFLSVFPVYIARDVGETRCGRCPAPDLKDGFVRDEIYETFMEQLRFPCVNHSYGCKQTMIPTDAAKHEQYCEFEPISCMVPLCNWNNPKHQLFAHIDTDHQDLILKQRSFELSFFESSEEINFVKYNSQLFLLHREYDLRSNELKVAVKHLIVGNSSANYNYLYYLKYSAGPNNYKSDKKSTVKEDNYIIENVKSLKDRLNNPTVIWISIYIGNLDDFQTSGSEKIIVDWDLLPELNCGICESTFKPPIHLCEQGHSLCEECRQQVENACPFCRKPMTNTKNYTLQNLIAKLNVRCKFHVYGCDYYANCYDIQDHLNDCRYSP